jgi:sugar phosphate isomerase/epimerase
VFVACSTLCFGKHPLGRALQIMGELEFSKIDVAIHEQGGHLRPSQIAQDLNHAAQQLRVGASLTPAAFSVEIEAKGDDDFRRQLRAVCHLARVCMVPLVSLPAASAGSGMDAEIERLTALTRLAEAEGVMLAIETRVGTLAETPASAVELCESVHGLGMALDPSHFIAGPHQGKPFDEVYPYVHHVRLRDTGRGPDQFQMRVGQGEVEYGRIVTQLARYAYTRALTVDIRDIPDAPFAMEPEVRKLKYLLESLV